MCLESMVAAGLSLYMIRNAAPYIAAFRPVASQLHEYHGTDSSEVSNTGEVCSEQVLGGSTSVHVPLGSGVEPSWCTCPPLCWKMTCRKLFVD